MSKFVAIALGVVPLCFVSGHADTTTLLQTFSVGRTEAVDKSIVNATCSCLSVDERCGQHVCPGCPVSLCHCPPRFNCYQLYLCCSDEQTEGLCAAQIQRVIKAGIQDRLNSARDDENHVIKQGEYNIQMSNDTLNEQEAELNTEKELVDRQATRQVWIRKVEETKWQATTDLHKKIPKRQTARQTQWETWQASHGMRAAVQRVLSVVQGELAVRDEPAQSVLQVEERSPPYLSCSCDASPCPEPPLCHVCPPTRCAPCAPQQPCAKQQNHKCPAEYKAVQDAIKAYNF